jgi:serine/threonine protein kinase
MLSAEWPQAKGVLTAAAKLPKGERTRFIADALPGRLDLWDKLLAILDGYDHATRIAPVWTGGTTFDAVLSGMKNEAPPPSDEPLLAAGATYGPYRILKQLGVGGMGQVFLAKDQRLNRLVAIKSLAGKWLASPTARPRLMREARAAAALSHPNIATLYDVLEDSGLLVMEYVDGRPASVLLQDGPLAVGYAVRLAIQIAEAVSYAHDRGIIHCDIKPGNVHVTIEGTAKVLDFGLARARFDRDDWEDLAPGQLLGTPGYMAPERLMHGTLNTSGDVYSLGVTIFEIVTGRRPFDEDELQALLLQVLSGCAPTASSIVPDVPAHLDRILDRALVVDPAQRYQSARELSRDLRALLVSIEPSTGGNVTPVTSRSGPLPIWLQRTLLGAASAVVGLLGLTLLGFITSTSYAAAFGLSAAFRQESWTTWPTWGLRSLLAPVVLVGGFSAAGIVVVSGLYHLLVTTVAPVRRVTHPIAARVNAMVQRIASAATPSTAAVLFIVQCMCLVFTYWWFGELLRGIDSLIVQSEGDLTPLNPINKPEHQLFRQVISLQLFAFAAAWATLIKTRVQRHEHGGAISLAGGVAVTVLTLILLVYPYRILVHNNHEQVFYHAQTCYLLGERSDEALLFCPSEAPPRNWIVKLTDPALKRGGPTENMFSRLNKPGN